EVGLRVEIDHEHPLPELRRHEFAQSGRRRGLADATFQVDRRDYPCHPTPLRERNSLLDIASKTTRRRTYEAAAGWQLPDQRPLDSTARRGMPASSSGVTYESEVAKPLRYSGGSRSATARTICPSETKTMSPSASD